MDETGSTDPSSSEAPKPAATQPGDDRVAALAAYLRTNSGRFTDEALAGAARGAGYNDAEIAAARQLATPGWQSGTGMPAAGPSTNRWVVAGVAIAYVVVLYLAITIAGSMSSDLSGTIGLVGLLVGVVGWALLRNREPSLAQGLGCGVVLAVAIPILVILVILGICVATGSFPTGP